MTCTHRWLLEPQRVAATGQCKVCGEQRQFSGGNAEDVMFEVVDGLLKTKKGVMNETWRAVHSAVRERGL